MTVSRALSPEHATKVRDDTRTHIISIAEKLGYKTNIAARALRQQRTYQFGLVVPYVHLSFLPEVIQGVQSKATENDYSCLLHLTAFKPEQEYKAIAKLVRQHVDGIIWLPLARQAPGIEALLDNVPVVQILHNKNPNLPAIVVDQEQGGFLAARHLIAQGHRHIASVIHKDRHGKQRLTGIQKALAEAHLPPSAVHTLTGRSWEEARHVVADALAEHPHPTAFICYSDLVAWGAMRAATDAGLRIPDDISLIGHDNSEMAEYFEPPLTTVAQIPQLLGEGAMQLLLDQLVGQEVTTRILTPELVVRGSTSCPGT